MAKRRSSRGPEVAPGLHAEDRHVLLQVVMLTAVVLAVLLVVSHVLLGGLTGSSIGWANKLRTGLGLLIFWLCVTAAVRSLHALAPRLNALWVSIGGTLVAVLGLLLFLLGLRGVAALQDSTAVLPSYTIIWFYALAGLFASLISLVRLRVAHRTWSYVLQIILVGAAMLLLFWYVR